MIRVPKIYLYRENGSELLVGWLTSGLSVASFSYTEAEGVNTDMLKVKLNVSEAYYSAIDNLTKNSVIMFTFGYMSWQSSLMRLMISSIKATYGSSGYIIELEAKPFADVLNPGNDPNKTLKDIYANMQYVLQVNFRSEEVVEVNPDGDEIADSETPPLLVLSNGWIDGRYHISKYGSVGYKVWDTVNRCFVEHAYYIKKGGRVTLSQLTNKGDPTVQLLAQAMIQRNLIDGLKQGEYVFKDGMIQKANPEDADGDGVDNDRFGAGVTTRGDKVIMLADAVDQIGPPSHYLYPNANIITIVFASKDKSKAALKVVNGTINPETKQQDIQTILTSSGYEATVIRVGTEEAKTDEYVVWYEDMATGVFYSASESGGGILLSKNTDSKLAKALSQYKKSEEQEAAAAALDASRKAMKANYGSHYTTTSGGTQANYIDDIEDVDLVTKPDATDGSEVRTDYTQTVNIPVASYVRNPTEDVDPEDVINSAVEGVNIGNALVGALDDENFYRNAAIINIEGKPTVRQGQTVFVGGFAGVYTGLYLIRKVAHNISPSGFISVLTCTKVPDVYSQSLEKARGKYGGKMAVYKEGAKKRLLAEFLKDRDALNAAHDAGAMIKDVGPDGATRFYKSSDYLVMEIFINAGAEHLENWKLNTNDGETVIETRKAKMYGSHTTTTNTNNFNTGDLTEGNKTNMNKKRTGAVGTTANPDVDFSSPTTNVTAPVTDTTAANNAGL